MVTLLATANIADKKNFVKPPKRFFSKNFKKMEKMSEFYPFSPFCPFTALAEPGFFSFPPGQQPGRLPRKVFITFRTMKKTAPPTTIMMIIPSIT
ncbi:MAG: hypothetical protein LBE14_04540 [Treponema sp.]|nr:hypothetical protein [Treponema sp.]